MKRPSRLYVIGRAKLRQSWNKYNLYNLAQMTSPFSRERMRTFYQQKFSAKAMTRSYHGENVEEKKWKRLLSRRLFTAVDMPPRYLARYDGSEQGAGRGSGKEVGPGERAPAAQNFSWHENMINTMIRADQDRWKTVTPRRAGLGDLKLDAVGFTLATPIRKITPYMQMLYWPLERRLDTAIFRALFASSVRQARQFVVHGAVTVNGLKIRHPQYLLNPGDMFQVDTDKVMYATGKARTAEYNASQEIFAERMRKQLAQIEAEVAGRKEAEQAADAIEQAADAVEQAADEEGRGVDAEAETSSSADPSTPAAPPAEEFTDEELKKRQRNRINRLVKSAKALLSGPAAEEMTAKAKQELRLFREEARRAMSALGQEEFDTHRVKDLTQFLKRFTIHEGEVRNKEEVAAEAARRTPTGTPAEVKKLSEERQEVMAQLAEEVGLTHQEQKKLANILREDEANPLDFTKPYMTPWSPRPYMAPFAFIPRYLEVNQRICAAVYLRHPVARRGMGEVPTPFPYEVNQLAYAWYLKR